MAEKPTKKQLAKEALKNPLNRIVVVGETGVKGFLDFIRTQGVIGLAVGLILGGAVTILVKSLVDNVILPPIGLLLGSGDGLKGLTWTIGKGHGGDPAIIYYGTFLNDFVNFIIIALVVYLVFHMLGLTKLDKKKE
ncbi:MAG: MscL family protein [Candidatus Microsaccharimonas sp.]